jgi:hypothetical protein
MQCDQDDQDFGDSDAERRAIQEGIEAATARRVRDFDEFDREFRARNGISRDECCDLGNGLPFA